MDRSTTIEEPMKIKLNANTRDDRVVVSGQVCLDFTLRVPRKTTDRQIGKMLRTLLEIQAVIGEHHEELTTEWHLPVPWEIQEDGRAEPKKAKRMWKGK